MLHPLLRSREDRIAFVISRRAALAGLAGSVALLGTHPTKAADTLRVGKAVAENFGYVPLDVGLAYGLFTKRKLDITPVGFTGGAKTAQAMAADAIDVALSAGPDMQFEVKGAPEIAVASISDSPAFMGYCIENGSPIRSLEDLKGKEVGVASRGSLTYWLVDELNRVKGWSGADRAQQVVIGGSTQATIAALTTKQVAASLSASQTGFFLEADGKGRLLADCSAYVPTLELFTIFAGTALTQQKPDALRRFLAGWYEAVAFMRSHKAETVQIAAKVMAYPPDVAARSYDSFMTKFSTDGRFKPAAIGKLRASFIDLKIVDSAVDMAKLYTDDFLPPRTT